MISRGGNISNENKNKINFYSLKNVFFNYKENTRGKYLRKL